MKSFLSKELACFDVVLFFMGGIVVIVEAPSILVESSRVQLLELWDMSLKHLRIVPTS